MAFKIKPPYSLDNTPIYHVDMEDGVLGKACLLYTSPSPRD